MFWSYSAMYLGTPEYILLFTGVSNLDAAYILGYVPGYPQIVYSGVSANQTWMLRSLACVYPGIKPEYML